VSLDETMRIMAPHVVGGRPAKDHNQRWINGLQAIGLAPPTGWRENTRDGAPGDGVWAQYRDNYAQYRDWALDAVLHQYTPACSGTPIAYGCDIDIPIAVRRKLCLLPDCGDRIMFWAEPGNGCTLEDEATRAAYAKAPAMEKSRAAHFSRRQAIRASDAY
jgi:hypothetical protein